MVLWLCVGVESTNEHIGFKQRSACRVNELFFFFFSGPGIGEQEGAKAKMASDDAGESSGTSPGPDDAAECKNSQGAPVPGHLFIACHEDCHDEENDPRAKLAGEDGESMRSFFRPRAEDGSCGGVAEGRERTFVFPGERVTVICTIEEDLTPDQVEALENEHCYWLGFHPSSDSGTPRGGDDDECDGDAGCASVLEASSSSRVRDESPTSPVAGLARAILRCEGLGDRAVIALEATVPAHLPANGALVTLDVKQYLRHPLGLGATTEEAANRGHEEDEDRVGGSPTVALYEHFLCRRWTRRLEVFRPLRVRTRVSGGGHGGRFVSAALANALPRRIECELSVLGFQLLSDPPGALCVSRIHPRRSESGRHAAMAPGTEHSFAILADPGPDAGPPPTSADLLVTVASSVSSMPLLYSHRVGWPAAMGPAPRAQLVLSHVGREEEAGSGLPLAKIRCTVRNLTDQQRTYSLVFDDLDVLGNAKAEGSSHAFMDTRVPVGEVPARSSKSVICRLMPMDSTIARVDGIRLVDDLGNAYANAMPCNLSC